MRLCLNSLKPLRSLQPELLDKSILFTLFKLTFWVLSSVYSDKLTVITKPAVASAWLLELGSKQYAYNMQCMLNKDLAQFI